MSGTSNTTSSSKFTRIPTGATRAPKAERVSLQAGSLGRNASEETQNILRGINKQVDEKSNSRFKDKGVKIHLRDFTTFRFKEEQRLLNALPTEQKRLLQDAQFGQHGTTKKKILGKTVARRPTFKAFFKDPLPAAKRQALTAPTAPKQRVARKTASGLQQKGLAEQGSRNAAGKAGTILTSPLGLTNDPLNQRRKTLLG